MQRRSTRPPENYLGKVFNDSSNSKHSTLRRNRWDHKSSFPCDPAALTRPVNWLCGAQAEAAWWLVMFFLDPKQLSVDRETKQELENLEARCCEEPLCVWEKNRRCPDFFVFEKTQWAQERWLERWFVCERDTGARYLNIYMVYMRNIEKPDNIIFKSITT